MNDQTEQYIQLVREINKADYTINTLLLQEFKILIEDELTTKQALILELVHKQQYLKVSEVSSQMDVSSSAVSQIISKLEKGNYVKRSINTANRQEILVELMSGATPTLRSMHR
jgi:DNA-binding MarR family transcriptional regulator